MAYIVSQFVEDAKGAFLFNGQRWSSVRDFGSSYENLEEAQEQLTRIRKTFSLTGLPIQGGFSFEIREIPVVLKIETAESEPLVNKLASNSNRFLPPKTSGT